MRGTLPICASGALLLATIACAGSAAAPAPARPPTIADLLRIDQAGAPLWAPDGQHVGFQWGLGAERDFWAADASAPRPVSRGDAGVRQLAPLTGRADAVVSPDWQLMAYVAKKHVWTTPLHGGRPVRVTTEEGKYSGFELGARLQTARVHRRAQRSGRRRRRIGGRRSRDDHCSDAARRRFPNLVSWIGSRGVHPAIRRLDRLRSLGERTGRDETASSRPRDV